jgi:AcrR family transcriptional regulator
MRLKQENKDKVKQRINESAINEFQKNGYHSASIRAITKNAKMTVGNLYRYYESKEELFDKLITPTYIEYVKCINKFRDHIMEESLVYNELPKDHSDELVNFIINNRKKILIMFEGSRGTKHENIREKIINDFMKSMKELYNHLRKSNPKLPEASKRPFIRIVSAGIVDTLIDMVKNFEDRKMLEAAILESIQYILFGFASLLK